jgi:glycosyltransferase involved in cell wall biosynthesis
MNKLAFVNDTVYGYASGASVVGGAERQQWLLARALARTGWSVIVGVRDGLQVGERRSIDNVNFVGIGGGTIYSAWYRFLAQERPHWWYWRCASHLWGPAVEVAKLSGVKTIFAAGFDTDVRPNHALVRRPRWWPLYAWGLLRTDRIFVQHTAQLRGLPLRWQPKAHLVRGIAGEVPSAVTPHAQRQQYVAWVAMLRQPKRPDLLVEIARKTPVVRFVVCGGVTSFDSAPGYGESVLAALRALPNVDVLGQVTPAKAQDVIANASVLLSTSDGEGFPNTFLQAWTHGTPVISLKIDPDGLIERHSLGTVSGTADRAARDIVGLIASPTQRDDLALNSRHYVSTAHSESAVAAAFQAAVSDVPRENALHGANQSITERAGPLEREKVS